MKTKTMHPKTDKDLAKELAKSQEKLANLRKDIQVKDLKEVSQIKKTRKEIARLKTLIREKEINDTSEKES